MPDLTAPVPDLPKSVPFTIISPSSGGTLQPDFCAYGTIDAALGVTVTVTLRVPGHPDVSAVATVNTEENTWEACFTNAPTGAGASVEATYPGGPNPGPTSDSLTIQDPIVEIEDPRDGGEFQDWNSAEGDGTADDQSTVLLYLTQAGYNLTGPPESLAAGDVDAATKTWKKALKKLVKKVTPKPGANFCLHVQAVKGGQTIQGASGFFKVK